MTIEVMLTRTKLKKSELCYVVIECNLDIRLRLLGMQRLKDAKRKEGLVLGLYIGPIGLIGPKKIRLRWVQS